MSSSKKKKKQKTEETEEAMHVYSMCSKYKNWFQVPARHFEDDGPKDCQL